MVNIDNYPVNLKQKVLQAVRLLPFLGHTVGYGTFGLGTYGTFCRSRYICYIWYITVQLVHLVNFEQSFNNIEYGTFGTFGT